MPQLTPSYTNRDFDGLVSELTSVIQRTRPDLISDFSDASMGALLRDLLAYVGDNVNYSIDSAALECFLATCRRIESGRMHAKSVGYVLRPASAAVALLSPDSLPPEITQFGATIKAGSAIKVSKTVQFQVVSDINIPINSLSIKVQLSEGVAYDETLPVVIGSSPLYTVSRPNVAADTWHVFVSGVEWTQVEDVAREITASNAYSVDFDASGRLQVQFGNGSSGAIPTSAIRVTYRTTAGAAGNLPAKAIRGSLPVTYTPTSGPGAGIPVTVNVAFENYFVAQAQVGDVIQRLNDSVGAADGSTTPALSVPYFPVQQGTLVLSIPGPSTGTLILTDSGNGTLVVVSNTTGTLSFTSGTLIPSTGAVALTFAGGSGQFPTLGTSVTATYYYYPPASSRTIETLGAATGGTDREVLTELKRNVVSYLRTANRMVAYNDYKDGLLRVPGIVLSFVERFRNAYSGNVASVYTWSLEQAQLRTRSNDTQVSVANYNRYSQISANLATTVQRALRARALLTVHHVIQQPAMLWIDAYLGKVSYDSTYSAQTVRDNILTAAIRYFQTASGFEFRLSRFNAAILSAPGVRYMQLPRVSLGYGSQDSTAESQDVTVASATQSGQLNRTDTPATSYIVSPGSVRIEIKQGTGSTILIDDGAGNLVRTEGSLNLVSGTVSYTARTWSATFTTVLTAYDEMSATFDDIAEDLRLNQRTIIGDADVGDYWPPPLLAQSDPIVTPPYQDGLPLNDYVAVATATVAAGAVTGVSVSVPGSYLAAPVITFTGGGGTGATAIANMVGNGIGSITVTSPGTGYATPPTVVIVGNYVMNYAPLRDILLTPAFDDAAYYDDSYYYNDGILYSSTGLSVQIIKAINLRNLTFDLVPL